MRITDTKHWCVFHSKVRQALAVLASNPVLMQNPQCLGDFVKSLSSPSPRSSPAEVVTSPMEVDGEDNKGLAARKAFWSKFKRTSAEPPIATDTMTTNQDLAQILSQPTLILGETVPDSPQTTSPEDPSIADPKPETVPPNIPEVPVPPVDPSPEVPVPPVDPSPGVEKTGEECAVRRRISKMDGVEMAAALQKAREHPSFHHYLKGWGITADEFGVNMIDELVAFTNFIEQTDSQPEGSIEPSPSEEPSPSAPAPPAHQPPSEPTPSPVASAQEHVSEALTRLQTVDLDNGLRPPQSCVANPSVVHTVVMLSLAGQLQPVTVPMTPEQCVSAGLTLANPICHKDVNSGSESTELVKTETEGKEQEKKETPEPIEEKTEQKERGTTKDGIDQDHNLDIRFPCTQFNKCLSMCLCFC